MAISAMKCSDCHSRDSMLSFIRQLLRCSTLCPEPQERLGDDTARVLAVLRRRWATVIATVVLAMAVAAGASITSTPQYTASSQVFVAVAATPDPESWPS